MSRRARAGALIGAISLLSLLGGIAGSGADSAFPAAGVPDRFDERLAMRDLRRQVEFGPRPAGSAANRRLTRFLARRLRLAGAEGVKIQRPHRNVVATIPGGRRTIVVGAHHDTKSGIPGFVGANDGASGVAVVLELARVLARRSGGAGPTIAIALFDAEEARGDRDFEEDGLRGSRQYVRYAAAGRGGTPSLTRIKAMVLFDLVGDCDLEIGYEPNSTESLFSAFEDRAEAIEEHGGPDSPFGEPVGPIGDDHIPFLEQGIDAVDLIDFDYGPGPSPGAWWHTAEDNLDHVCSTSLDEIGETAAATIGDL